MKSKYLKSIALISLATTSISFAQPEGSEREAGVHYQTLDGLNKVIDINAPDYLPNRGFGTGNYYLFLGASGAASTDSALDYSYGGGGCMQVDGASVANGDFDMAVQLPDGHQILGYRYYWFDNSASSSQAQLFYFDGTGGFSFWDANVSTGDTGYGDGYVNVDTENVIVDNFGGYYVVRFRSDEDGSNQRICGIRFFIDSDPS